MELLQEIAYVALPASPAHVLQAMKSTRLARLLAGYRGNAGVDIARVADRLAQLGAAYAGLKTPARTLELNPVVVVDADHLYVIDALVSRRGARMTARYAGPLEGVRVLCVDNYLAGNYGPPARHAWRRRRQGRDPQW